METFQVCLRGRENEFRPKNSLLSVQLKWSINEARRMCPNDLNSFYALNTPDFEIIFAPFDQIDINLTLHEFSKAIVYVQK